MLRGMRRLLGVVLVGTWLALLGTLAHRQATGPMAVTRALPEVRPGERDEWFTVEHDTHRIGWAHRTTARTDGGYRVSEELVVALSMLGTSQTVHTTLVADTDDAFALRAVRFALVSPATTFTADGATDGRTLRVTYGQAGGRDTVTLPLTEPIYLPGTLRPRIVAGPLLAGTRYGAPVLNPLTLRNEPFTATVEGTERVDGPEGPVDAIRLVEEQQGLQTRVWLARDGSVVREEGGLGFVLQQASRDAALARLDARDAVDMVATTRIPLAGSIAAPREAAHLVLRVDGAAAGRIPDAPPRQRLHAGRLEIARERPPAALPLPLDVPHEVAPLVAPSPFVESDDPAIVGAVRRVVGDERDAVAVARRLTAWVYGRLDKAPSVTVPSARAVLAAGRGDCNEHAVLLAAAARAAGIPARVVAGAVYMDGGFYYHAWDELWLGAWVTADATLGQLPADATHVKLVDGGPERQGELAALVGRLAFATAETPG
jgi:hypothetical protein